MEIKKKNTKLIILILLASIAVSFVLGKFKSEPDKIASITKPPVVASLVLKKEEVQMSIESQGMVTPLIETILSAEVSGTIVDISPQFLAGGVFRKGETLIRIDPTTYIVALDQAKALNNQRQNEYEDAEKIRKQGYLSESEYLSIVTALAASEAGLVKAQRNLDKTKIQLPYAGMVRGKSADLGQYVNLGTKLGITFATDFAEIRLPLSNLDLAFADLPTSKDISSVTQVNGPRVEFTTDQTGSSLKREGYIVRSEGVVDERTRMTYAVARIDDPYNLGNADNRLSLPMGTFVSARIFPDENYNSIRIPRSAIINNRQVIVIDESNRIFYRDIKLMRADKDFGYVISGVSDGERISMTPIEDGINGMLVRVEQ
ncbi:MAG TPA: efflux RND transporter periplasmic adaptor subunit [Woeseiaceae bacterium]|nr:efflux RND transporter periplasmic adaptor subunit [Woeseiaceae bacterium]|tara:strand:+ start:3492 stop:4613 length:1122 start_codon:yes stop_codon:yes gene_type:complete